MAVESFWRMLGRSALIYGLSAGAAAADDGSDFILGLVVIAAVLYLIPTWVAFLRRHPNRWAIFIINVVFGGTGLGWFGSLLWALSAVHRSLTGSHGGESGLNLFVNDREMGRSPDEQILEQASPLTLAQKDPSDHLLKIKKLRDEGALSEDEYRQIRQPIIDALRR